MSRLCSRRTLLTGVGIAGTLSRDRVVWPAELGAQATPATGSVLSVAPDDPAIEVTAIPHPVGTMTYTWYEARPIDWRRAAGAPRTADEWYRVVLVCHDRLGLTPHVEDVTRRLAMAGYITLAMDFLTPAGGTAAVRDPAAVLAQTDARDLVAGLTELVAIYTGGPPERDRFAVVGFGFGADIAGQLIAKEHKLNAAVLYYGGPHATVAQDIHTPVLGIYAADPSDRATQGRDELATIFTAANVEFRFETYPGTVAGFYDDSRPHYVETQAVAAWNDTLAWLADHLAPDSPYV